MKEEALPWADIEPTLRAVHEGRRPWVIVENKDCHVASVLQADSISVRLGAPHGGDPWASVSGSSFHCEVPFKKLIWDKKEAHRLQAKILRDEAAVLLANAKRLEEAN